MLFLNQRHVHRKSKYPHLVANILNDGHGGQSSKLRCLTHDYYPQIKLLQSIQQPSADKLRYMLDTVDQHLRMLRRFDTETDL